MSNILRITKAEFINTLWVGRENKDTANPGGMYARNVVVYLVLAVGILLMALVYGLFQFSICYVYSEIGTPDVIVTLNYTTVGYLILIFGSLHTLSSLYFSKDVEMLMPFPLKPYEIVMGKLCNVFLTEFLVTLPFILVTCIVYGLNTSGGVLAGLRILFVSILYVLALIGIGAFAIIVLMSLVNLYKYKDYLTVAVSFMLVAFGIKILMVLSQQLPNIGGPDLLDSIKSGNVDFIGGVGSSFPPSIWATYASCSGFPEGIAYMLAIIAGAVVALVLLMISCNLFYFPSILNGSFSSSSNGTLRDSKIVKIKRLRPEISIFKSEWKTFLRTPVFFTNGLMVTVLMVFIPFLFDGNQAIEKSVEFISGSSHPVRTVILCFAIISLCSCVSIIPSTAISREGKSLWVMLVSPIGLESALRGKVLHAISVTIINVMVSSLVLILYFHVNMAYVVEGAVMALCIAVAVINFNILIDLTKPKLNWKDPFEVLKVNLNILVGMVVSIGILSSGLLIAILLALAGLKHYMIFTIMGVLFITFTAISKKVLYGIAANYYTNNI